MKKFIPGHQQAAMKRKLLVWFREHKREMPWRGARDPYRIWLSEIMLQQTRVAAVVPYYEKFLRRFPSLRALARARVEEVLKHWAGLGYYSRARNLHRAAKEIVAQRGGQFPRKREEALALPGVGSYTAAAVLSIAYGAPLAVLDGNVARVLARLRAVRGDLRELRRWRGLEETAQELLATQAPGEWNQAMMELGATVCTPRAPRCEVCPVSRWCRARAMGIADEVPEGRKKRAAVKVRIVAAVLVDAKGRTVLVREEGGLFSGMWQFPAVEVKREAREELEKYLGKSEEKTKNSTQRTLRAPRLRRGKRRTQRRTDFVELPEVRHSVTYREITLAPFVVRVARSISNLKFEISKRHAENPQSRSPDCVGTSSDRRHKTISNLKFEISKAGKKNRPPSSLVRQKDGGLGMTRNIGVRVVRLEKVEALPVSSATRKIAKAAIEYFRGNGAAFGGE